MGRYYSGDINGKFWFGVQDSNAADRFGGVQLEPSYIYYNFMKDNFELSSLNELLVIVNNRHSKEFTLETDPDELNGISADVDLADLQLGLKIYQYLQVEDSCYFEAEL